MGAPGLRLRRRLTSSTCLAGLRDLDVSAAFNDVNDVLVGYLVDPQGRSGCPVVEPHVNSSDTALLPTGAVDLYKDAPQAGQWEVVFDWLQPVSGAELAEPFSGDDPFQPGEHPRPSAAHSDGGEELHVRRDGDQHRYSRPRRTSSTRGPRPPPPSGSRTSSAAIRT